MLYIHDGKNLTKVLMNILNKNKIPYNKLELKSKNYNLYWYNDLSITINDNNDTIGVLYQPNLNYGTLTNENRNIISVIYKNQDIVYKEQISSWEY